MTQPNITPQGFRTAAYLETKARMDAARSRSGKTRRRVTCTPPNVKCGGRCIPPNWDCRLKGKGPDSHLRAVRTDPISGLANIERGVKRISKGVRKGSFSEIEGGKRAIVRGVVKATPGDIQRKKKLQADLERRAGGIAAGLAVVGFGLFSHNQLKRASFYRDGVGRQIDDAVAAGINRVLDATPVIRRARAERRAAGSSAAGEVVARAAGAAARGPEAMRGALLSTPTQLERRATEYGNAKVLENKIKALDIEAKELNMNASTWRQKNLETFWGATRTNAGGAGDGSTFSEPATNQYLSRQFGFKLKKGDDATAVRRSVATALNREAFNLQALARQEGVNLKDADSRNAFLNRVVGPGTANFSDEARARAVSNLDRIIGDAPRGRSTAVSRKQLADTFYRDTRDGFDRYFGRIADEVRQPAGAALSAEARKAGYSELLTSARIGQSRYLAKSLNKPEAVGTKMGQGLSDLVAKEYYSSKVIGSPTFTATDREIRLAASELSGRSFSTTAPATDYLRSNGFERLTTLRGSQTRVRSSTPSPEKPDRPARRRSNAQRIADLMRQKNKDGTPRYATREAAEAALKRMRKDELQQARIDAYLAVRADLRGKPCGASHIPKAHECRKGTAGSVDEKTGERTTTYKARQLTSIALRIGATGAMGAAAVSMLRSGGDSTAAGYLLLGTALGTASLIREAKVTRSPKELKAEYEALKKADGVEPETINKIQNFIEETGTDVQRVGALKALMLGGYFTTDKPNRVHVVGGQPTVSNPAKGNSVESYSKGVASYMDARNKYAKLNTDGPITPAQLKGMTPDERKRYFMAATSIGNTKGQQLYLMSHELGHAIHYRSNFATPNSVTVNGKKYSGKELEAELRRSTSIYGMSDIRQSDKVSTTNYYSQGNRLETFAENFALYVGNGKKMKETYPVSYEWTKRTFDNAIRQPSRKAPVKMKTTIEELAKGTERFDAEASFEILLDRIMRAATSGNIRGTLGVLKDAQGLRKDELAMLTPFLETAQMYAGLRQGARSDAAGKPCGASHIPKAHTCTKGAGRTVAQQKKREAVPQDKELQQLSALEKEMDRERDAKKSLKGKQIATALVIGTVGAVAVAAANDAYQLSSGMGTGTTPGLRTAVKPFMSDTFSKTDPKGLQAALGNYYDSKVKAEGWKTGDLVFKRTKNEPTAHFAIYMGSKNGVHSFAQVGADGLVAKSGGIEITEAGQGANRKLASGVVFERAPSGKQPKIKYSPAQIAARVESLKGKTLDYDVFNANCESWARMIVSGNSRSTQSARLSQVGKLAIRGVYKGLGEVVKWSPDYVPETVKGDRIYKVAKWLDRNNTRGNDSGYSAMVLGNKNLRKDSPESDAVGLIDPGKVIKPEMSDIEAVAAAKRWLMVLSGVIANDPKS
jgi:hypothetical protein